MNFLEKILGIALEDIDNWGIHWAYDGSEWVLALLGFLVVIALRYFWTSLRRISSPLKKYFLFFLRVATFALLMLTLLQPSLEFNKARTIKNSIAVLLDDSKSMTIKTFPQEKMRMDLVSEIIKSNEEVFSKLEKDFDLDFYFVSDHVDAVARSEIATKYVPKGVNTDFNRVMLDLNDEYKEKSLQGVVLLTDGADLTQETSGVSAQISNVLKNFEGPVHTFQAGSNDKFMDIGIESVDSGDFGFVHQPLNITVTITASSMGEKSVPLILKEKDKILVSKTIKLVKGQRRYKEELQITPTLAGKNIYSLTIPLFVGESIETNNRLDFQIKVMRDRIRVLHLTGRPSWDSRFLREVLTNNPKVDLLSFFILRSLTDNVEASTGELSLIPFPTNLLFSDYLSSFDLVVFHNFKYSPFINKNHLENMKTYVQEGGAFIMVGGDLSFHGGDYRRTALEEILPVTIQNSAAKILMDEFKINIKDQIANHPILRLEKNIELNNKIWESLPPLNGLNISIDPHKDAQVLAGYEKNSESLFYPLLATRKVGKGRSLIFASDSSWNWNFKKVGEGGSGRYYQKFWDNVIEWITDSPETALLKLVTDKEKYGEGEKVEVKVIAMSEEYNPLPEAEINLSIRGLSDKNDLENVNLNTDQNGYAHFEFQPPAEGFYHAKAEMESKNTRLSDKTIFSVFSPSGEFQRPLINEKLLKSMAELTGGTYNVIGKNSIMSSLVFPNPEIRVEAGGRSISLWDSWWTYGFIVGFLFIDWWLRRKSGLS
ncbi:MAG: glutamine amidotransferase [Nitrospinales bacterium]